WTRADVVKHLARCVPNDIGDAESARRWVEREAERVLAARGVMRIGAPQPDAPSVLRRRDGLSVFDAHNAVRYSTEATLAVEQRVLDTALAGRDAGRAVALDAAVHRATHRAVGVGQAAAVRDLTMGGGAVACLIGPAGAGKSHTVGAAARAWTDSGIPVHGVALSAVAAGVLAGEA